VLEARRLARTQDRSLASRLGAYLFARRTFTWDIELERKIASLSAAEVNAALKKHIDPARLSVIMAGDFKKPSAASSAGRESPPAAAPGAAAAAPRASPRPSAASD
jgi:zinc protease